jgi:PAS domain S-box-containing protein
MSTFPENLFYTAKPYISFLQKEYLKNISSYNLRLIKEYNLYYLEIGNLKDENAISVLEKEWNMMLRNFKNNSAAVYFEKQINNWKSTSKNDWDIYQNLTIKKNCLLYFLPEFDSRINSEVLIEIEDFFNYLSRYLLAPDNKYSSHVFQKTDLLSALIKSGLDGVMIFDKSLNIIECNEAVEEKFSISRDLLIGNNIFEVIPVEKATEEAKYLIAALEGKTSRIPEKKDEFENKWYNSNYSPFYDSQGILKGIIHTFQDITELKKKELSLKDHKEELAAANEELVENLSQLEEYQQVLSEKQELLEESTNIAKLGTFQYNLSNQSVVISEEFKRIFELDQDIFSIHLEQLIHLFQEKDQSVIYSRFHSISNFKHQRSLEFEVFTRRKKRKWLLLKMKPIKDESKNRIFKVRGIVQDISERKEAELKIIEEQHFIKSITETSPDLITVFDIINQKNVYANKEIFNVLGYSVEDLRRFRESGNQELFNLIHPDDLPSLIKSLTDTSIYKDDHVVHEITYRIKVKEGIYKSILGRYRVFKRDEKGHPIQLIGISRDITEKNQIEKELREAYMILHQANSELLNTQVELKNLNSELEERVDRRTTELKEINDLLNRTNIDLENFIYSASHDLKAPINNLEGLIILLKKTVIKNDPVKVNEIMDMMNVSMGRLVRTINDLVEVSKMQNDLSEGRKEQVDIHSNLKSVLEDIEGLIQSKNAIIDIDLEQNHIYFARQNFRSLLYNLISNSLKYCNPEKQPVIKIKTYLEGSDFLLEISDNGLGIKKEQQEKIFSFFKRFHNKFAEGSGIGLYIVKRIVESTKSKIRLNSEPGVGSRFIIQFHSSCTVMEKV